MTEKEKLYSSKDYCKEEKQKVEAAGMESQMIDKIEKAIIEEYEKIKQKGKIFSGIEDVCRQIRFQYPELAIHIKKRMMEIAKRKGDLP